MKKTLFCILWFLIGRPASAYVDSLSTEYPFLHNIHFKCAVLFDRPTGIYRYSYLLSSDISNNGEIWKIKIDISRNAGSEALDTSGLTFSRHWIEREFQLDMAQYWNRVVPVSASHLPTDRWDASVANGQVIDISVLPPRPKPGESVSGIELTSKGLPAIRRAIILPWFDEQLFFPALDDTSQMATTSFSPEKEDSLRRMVNHYCWTVGPFSLAENSIPNTILDTLLSYTRQSADLGWLAPMHPDRRIDWDDDCDNDERTQDGITANIERRLTMAQRELEKEDSVKARRELQTLLQKVERIWKRSQAEDKKKGYDRRDHIRSKNDRIIMTSEAYALLKYNLEYLIDRLPEKTRREREPRREEKK